MSPRIGDQLRGRIETHRLRIEERGAKRRGLVMLEPRRYVDQQCERCRMRFRKPVFAEAENLLIDLAREVFSITARRHPVDQTLLEFFETPFAPPCGHRATQSIGFAGRESRS